MQEKIEEKKEEITGDVSSGSKWGAIRNSLKNKIKETVDSAASDIKERVQEKIDEKSSLGVSKSKKLGRALSMVGGADSVFAREDIHVFAQVLLPLGMKFMRISNFEKEGEINLRYEILALTLAGIFSSGKIFICYCLDTALTLSSLYFSQGVITDKATIRTLALIPWYFVYMMVTSND